MVEAEWFIGHLRSQAWNLQSLLCYLDNRETVEREDDFDSADRLRELIGRLKEIAHVSLQHGEARALRAQRLNEAVASTYHACRINRRQRA